MKTTPFVADMRDMLKTLQAAYDYPVDVEFTANFVNKDQYQINLVQCRPLQVKGGGVIADPPEGIAADRLVLKARGAVIGQSRIGPIDRLIYVTPSVYGQLPITDRYSVARLIGQISRLDGPQPSKTIMLLGPGRWGTTTPALGVPVSFAEINNVSILCEIVAMRDDLVPDVSLGTHFFSEMVEMDMLYLALFPHQEDNYLNEDFFASRPNRLPELIPSAANWSQVVRVIDIAPTDGALQLLINANTLKQKVVCYLDPLGSK